MAQKNIARRAAGKARRVLYPEVDKLRAERAELRKQIKELTKKRPAAIPKDVDEQTREIIALARPYTMTGNDKLIALAAAARHVARTGIPGDVVECGVWRGGSIHTIARVFEAEGVLDREIHLFDTFEGMTEPTEKDVRAGDGRTAGELLEESSKTKWVWAVASLEDVQEGIRTLNYPWERFHFCKGPVEETIPSQAPDKIALLRLDTDWYESTKHELDHLYDRLVSGGILIIDDYGSWEGSREATDEFMEKLDNPPLMLRAGRSRIGVKP